MASYGPPWRVASWEFQHTCPRVSETRKRPASLHCFLAGIWRRSMRTLRGGCLCGAVEYEIPDALRYAGYCHCSECRRFSGSAFSAFGGISKANFRVLKGAESIKHYAKNANTILGFCNVCGSSLYAEKRQREMINLRLGTLRDTPSLAPQAHAFVGSKAPWHEIRDDLVQFDGAPSPSQWPRTASDGPASRS
jgi:hypothetical protein